jgi:hypothetical protein
MSTINTSAIDGNYPIPGQNNSSQGFRNNFQAITQNLNIAGDEITDLQNNAVLKAPLANTILNNDMANALISNCSTLAFRATTYNLGNALVGTVLVDVSLGDVQYGNVDGNVTLQFGGWAPTLTSQTITLQLGIANANAVITWPAEVLAFSDDYGVTMLENYEFTSNVATVTAPNDVTQLNYRLTSIDCGNSIYIEPINRPYQSAQIVQRTPPPTGLQGDVAGTVAVDENYLYVCTADFDSGGANTKQKLATQTFSSNNEILLNNLTDISADIPVIFQGNTFGGIEANTVYYVKSLIGGNTTITISDTRTAGTAGSTFVLSNASGSCDAYFYLGSDIWKRVALSTW